MKNFKKIRKLFLIILVLNLLFILYIHAKTDFIAKVKLPKGKIYFKLKTDKRFKKIKSNQKLEANTIVKTDKKSSVTLKLKNGSLIELKENSRIILNKELLKNTSVSLIQGRAKFKIAKLLRRKEYFNVYTPTAVVGVRGTEYELGIADDGSVAVNVNEGGVAVNNGQSETTLTKNQSTEASVDSTKLSRSKKQMDINKWNKEKNDEIQKQPAKKINSINNNLNATEKNQEKTLKELSIVKKGDEKKAGENVDAALFNQCKTEGLYVAAKKIKENNKDNKEVRDSYKKTSSIYNRLQRLNRLIDERFDRIDKIFEQKEKAIDKKIDDTEKKFEEKFKKYK